MDTKAPTHNVIHLNERKALKTEPIGANRGIVVDRFPKIISITSGKGGVGKTNIVANLGYTFRRFGKKVLIFDADLGLGNLDVLLGLTPRFNLSHVIRGEKQIADVVVDGPGGMKILPAASGIQDLTALTQQERYLVFSQLEAYIHDFDIMLIDTAAGISSNVLYFNINSDEILVVATPEPTSITDAYAMMKVLSVKYGTDHFKLVVNSAATPQEAEDVFRQLNLVTDRFLDISMEYYGYILLDENIKKGVRQQKAVTQMAPMAKASQNFGALARKITSSSVPARRNGMAGWRSSEMMD
ncbi:MAG: MinD/ParA family protein [Desulfatitalea sp.]|nr:MinD/ParA family protein [Desulfatitalea sp.]NNK00853.1 MinD/ParA family protein [Desulfatitalea sp.]